MKLFLISQMNTPMWVKMLHLKAKHRSGYLGCFENILQWLVEWHMYVWVENWMFQFVLSTRSVTSGNVGNSWNVNGSTDRTKSFLRLVFLWPVAASKELRHMLSKQLLKPLSHSTKHLSSLIHLNQASAVTLSIN